MPLYRKIALASTFSPRFVPLVKEARRFAEQCGAEFCVVHVGPLSTDSESRFRKTFQELQLDPVPVVHWRGGEPAEAIVDTIRQQGIDLLVAGARDRESTLRHFLGDVARLLMRKSPSSLLLLPKASSEPQPFRHIAVLVDFSEASAVALRKAIALAEAERAESLHVIRIYTVFAQALAQADSQGNGGVGPIEAEQDRLDRFVEAAGLTDIPISTMCVEGTTGFAASDYVQDINAQLLVIPSALPGKLPLFPDRTDWITDVIPTNLLVVRG